jgi:ABC-type transport system involved in cytochrome c biogenesis permease subunit
VFSGGFQAPEGREEVSLLRNLMVTYWNGQQLEFDMAARAFSDSIHKRFQGGQSKVLAKIPLEIAYNNLNLFLIAKMFYAFAFLIFLFSLISERKFSHSLAVGFIVAGFIPHFIALLMRAVILTRPPVSSLYETFIFVSFVAVLLGLLIERFNKQWLGIVVASVCGFVFLLIASKFSAEGDTLKMLVAVLNSNFWLSTHVLSITTGYAGSCVAGIVGHVYILQAIARPKDRKLLDSTYRNLLGILGFGLAMTFLGTNLGGIWADQSWGRFWGWDPKENGALLIVIWTAIIFHAKIAKMVGPLGTAVMSALLIVVVMWAWFGVNLLSIGLHSYGFTSGLAFNLTVYVVLQLLFLGIAVPIAARKLKN